MRKFALLAGAGALVLAGTAAFAAGADSIHTMTIQLPGGGLERIQYSGNVAPKVSVETAPFDMLAPQLTAFGDFDRISAMMDAQMAQMQAAMQQADALAARQLQAGNNPIEISAGSMPAGSSSYSVVTSFNGGKFCERSVEITRPANGGKVNVVNHTSGDCGPNGAAAAHPAQPKSSI